MKPITEELIKQHLGDHVHIQCDRDGKWHVADAGTGLKGFVSAEGIDLTVIHPDASIESYIPAARLTAALFCDDTEGPEFFDYLARHFAKAMREHLGISADRERGRRREVRSKSDVLKRKVA